ncbi:MAG TPA: quinolinate synthase NadA [Clostridia bacterium]|nr:quinolinate synthase NadA [Clostridia bacterium]
MNELERNPLIAEINRLKQDRKAIILAHYYQRPEIQDIADFIGDSLELSRKAAATDAEVIVFCGVKFMAENAAILSPDKKVLLPEPDAGCFLADMVTVEKLRETKDKHPDAVVVCYVNSPAAVKAESDIACTSANATRVIESLPADREILFIPDRNLGKYIARCTGRDLILWDGYCNVHDAVSAGDILRVKEENPNAMILIHPECAPEVIDLADLVGSTSGIINYAGKSEANEFIVGTERGILHHLNKLYPEKKFILPTEDLRCDDMKKIDLEKLHATLDKKKNEVRISAKVREKAIQSLKRMLAV